MLKRSVPLGTRMQASNRMENSFWRGTVGVGACESKSSTTYVAYLSIHYESGGIMENGFQAYPPTQPKAAGRRGGSMSKLNWGRRAYALFLLCATTAIAPQFVDNPASPSRRAHCRPGIDRPPGVRI
jgi:hypothetical protein